MKFVIEIVEKFFEMGVKFDWIGVIMFYDD